MKKSKLILLTLFIFSFFISDAKAESWWEIQAIDTVKYSRDKARENLTNKEFEAEIDKQIRLISETGATHVAIGTPYDEEFYPYLEKWVQAARKYNMNVWFRGNFSGWEGWFDYEEIDREKHKQLLNNFLYSHKNLFSNGDIFTPCPECENGGPGDPRSNNDVTGHREFLISEYKITSDFFKQNRLDIKSNLLSMNGDVAKLIMDKETTVALGGIVTIDHYVKTPQELERDIRLLALRSGGKIVLGEFGAPIPDIHGDLSEKEQADWIKLALENVTKSPDLIGLNYWTNMEGSTHLWDNDGTSREAVSILKKYFEPKVYRGKILDTIGLEVSGASIKLDTKTVISDKTGNFVISYIEASNQTINVSANGYKTVSYKPVWNDAYNNTVITLEPEDKSLLFKVRMLLQTILDFVRIQILKLPARNTN